MSQDWYSPSYSPPDHAYTPTGDVPDDVEYYPSDYDYSYDEWQYDNRPRGTGRKLPAPPPTTDYSWPTPTPTVNGDYNIAPSDDFANTQRSRPADTTAPVNGYSTDDMHHDYTDYNGYYDPGDDYYDGSDGYDRMSEMYDDRYYTSFDGEYGDGLVNGYAEEYMHTSETERHQPAYYDYNSKPYDVDYQMTSQYDGTQLGTDVDQQSAQYQLTPVVPATSPAVQVGDGDQRPLHDAIYDDGYIDRDGVYHHYDDRRYDDERYYNNSTKYVASIPSDAGESAYDVDELAEVMSSVPARSSVDSSATPAVRYDRYYEGKTDSFESYDRDSMAYDATTAMKDSGYQTFNQQQSLPSEPEQPYFNHVDVNSWQPPTVNGDVRRSPITVIDAQAPRQSFLVSHPAENTFAPSADQRWPTSSPPASYFDGLSNAPAAAGFCDALIPTSSVDSTTIGY